MRPGNLTGLPSLGGGATAASAFSTSIQVGSGADTPDAPGSSSSNLVTRNTVADPLTPTTFSAIGGA